MEQISDTVKALRPEYDAPSAIEERLATLLEMRLDQIDGIALSPVSKVPAMTSMLCQCGLRRTIEFTESAIQEINRLNVTATCVLVRSALETACFLWEVTRRMEAVAASGDDAQMRELGKFLNNALLGSGPKAKTFALSPDYVQTNVLTHIQRLSKEFDVPLEGFYEGLSEHAHPNYHGMMATYTEAGHDTGYVAFTDRRSGRIEATLILAMGALASSLDIVEAALHREDRCSESLAALSEKQFYDSGKWPADEEYPVARGNEDQKRDSD